MEQKYINEVLSSNEYEALLNFYSKEELKTKLATSSLDKKQFDILFGAYGVIFPSIETIKEDLAEATADALQTIVEENDQEFSAWLEKQSVACRGEARNLRNIVCNNPITFSKEYVLEDGQLCHVLVKKTMIENLMGTDKPEIMKEVPNLVKEVLERCIGNLRPKKDSAFWLRKYRDDYMDNRKDKELLENFITQAKEETFAKSILSFFDPDMVLNYCQYRELQKKSYETALAWQERFNAEKFSCVSRNYPTIRSVETADFKAIGKLIEDLRQLNELSELTGALLSYVTELN